MNFLQKAHHSLLALRDMVLLRDAKSTQKSTKCEKKEMALDRLQKGYSFTVGAETRRQKDTCSTSAGDGCARRVTPIFRHSVREGQ